MIYELTDLNLRNLILAIAKETLKKNSLVISDNLLRVMAVSARNQDMGVLLAHSNRVIWFNSYYQMLSRIFVTALAGIGSAIYLSITWGLLLMLGGYLINDPLEAACNVYFRAVPEVHREDHRISC